jgi:intraflagellar transport protein 172
MKTYHQWLNETEQFEKSASLREKEGDNLGAINLYMRANMPARASIILMNDRELVHNQELIGKIATSLIKSDLYESVSRINFFLI